MTIRVLTADDHPVVRTGIAAMIANESDMTVIAEASDGAKAIALYAEHKPDVVLMDLRMPGMDGLEAIRRLRAGGSSAAIGALTAGAFGNDEREALDAGADFFMRKPFNARELLDQLARVLDARGATSAPSG